MACCARWVGSVFFGEVHISLVNLILVTVIRYQDQSLRKNLLPTHPRGFSRGSKIHAYSSKQTQISLTNTGI